MNFTCQESARMRGRIIDSCLHLMKVFDGDRDVTNVITIGCVSMNINMSLFHRYFIKT